MSTTRLIAGGRLAEDRCRLLETGEAPSGAPLPAGPLLVSLALWRERRDELLARGEPAGVLLEPSDDPAAIAADLPRLSLVAVRFPKFTDGRGYSIATLLRRRHGWRGELRAVGDVQRDQLFYLARCGFDAFLLKEGQDAAAALASLADFSTVYQTAADGRPPAFRTAGSAP